MSTLLTEEQAVAAYRADAPIRGAQYAGICGVAIAQHDADIAAVEEQLRMAERTAQVVVGLDERPGLRAALAVLKGEGR
jgi:hypothetical protein